MSAERSTDGILDLLYGELSEDEARQMREDLAESAELRGEFDEFEGLLGKVREVMPGEDVSPSVHASIMDAARAGVHNAEEDRSLRRVAPEQGFWKRVGRGQGSQIALVAAVLIAGLFVVKAVDRGSSPLHAPAGDISAMQEAAPAMEAPAPAAAEAEQKVAPNQAPQPDSPAFADGTGAEGGGGEAITDQWSPEPVAADDDGAARADVADSLRAELAQGRRDQAQPKDSKEQAPKAEPAPAEPKPASAPETRAKREAPAKPKRARARSSAQPASKAKSKKSVDSLLDMMDGDAFGSSKGNSSSSSTSGLLGGKAGLDVGSTAPVSPPAAQAPDEAQAAADEEKTLEYRAPANSLDEVNSYFRAGDWGGTIRSADEFLSNNKTASATDKASAMFAKAQSLQKQGKFNEADRIYSSMQKNYPTFNTAAVNAAREEIKKKNVRKPAPTKARSKADDMEMDKYAAPESESAY